MCLPPSSTCFDLELKSFNLFWVKNFNYFSDSWFLHFLFTWFLHFCFTFYIRPRKFVICIWFTLVFSAKRAWVLCCARIPCILIISSFSVFHNFILSRVSMCLVFLSFSWSLWRMRISWVELEFSVDVNCQTNMKLYIEGSDGSYIETNEHTDLAS